MKLTHYGRLNSLRTAEQTDIVYFWSEHSYVQWNRTPSASRSVAPNARDTARLLMVHLGTRFGNRGFEAKYVYRFGGRDLAPIPATGHRRRSSWTPADQTTGISAGFYSTAVTDAVARFFGTNKVVWTITTLKANVPRWFRQNGHTATSTQ